MQRQAFTLIELSIVLVIIGLIVGGILVGQDLIKAAEVRAQLSQIEKFNTAVNTFRGKFGGIPGDLSLSLANQYGFATPASCTGAAGARDGNGLIDGWAANPVVQGEGETTLFWQDITSATAGNLIEGSFPNSGGAATTCSAGGAVALTTTQGTTYIGDYFPQGKIGHGNFIYVYETSGFNWYGLSAVTSTAAGGNMFSGPTIPVMQSYNMDRKTDDGIPTTGVVQALYLNNFTITSASPASADSTATCYNTTANAYSIGSFANYGANGNCALSFRFQ